MDKIREGSITSSEIVALTTNGKTKDSFGKPFYTYVKQCNQERRLGKSLEVESNAKPLTWGKIWEPVSFEKLGIEYRLCSSETLQHPKIKDWVGSPDGEKFDEGKTVIDLKNPITMTSFCDLVDPLYNGLSGMEAMNAVRDNHKDGDKYYFQIVSNGILTGAKYGELIVHMPYEDELEMIKLKINQIEDPSEQRKYYWLYTADDSELPSLKRDGVYKDINIIRFEIPKSDKKLLTSRVYKAVDLLIPRT